ncbi:MAG: glycine cleavage system aminomethyltransferase GcvT, partial [Spirochaetes bacterium]|nr:glycine cleavage system aminomethyltransferase GcvT [Spirochaetota bacterium]
MDDAELRRTSLHGWHAANGGRMVPFGGWQMPVQYAAGPREEHQRVRTAAGLFDTCHMGRLLVDGHDAAAFLQRMQTWDVSRLGAGRAHYAMLLREGAGVLDDIFVYRLDPGWLLVVNASNRDKDLAHLTAAAAGLDVRIRDLSDATGMILASDAGLPAYHRVVRLKVAGIEATVCATGYTGEPGYELVVPVVDCAGLWEALLAAGAPDGIAACGLAARDSLRTEACLPRYGHELDETVDPVSAGLDGAAVRMPGHDFIGKSALASIAATGPARRLIAFRMAEAEVPQQGYPILAGDRAVGAVSTGLFSPSTGLYVGMGYVEAASAEVGGAVHIVIRDTRKAARIVERPFYWSP